MLEAERIAAAKAKALEDRAARAEHPLVKKLFLCQGYTVASAMQDTGKSFTMSRLSYDLATAKPGDLLWGKFRIKETVGTIFVELEDAAAIDLFTRGLPGAHPAIEFVEDMPTCCAGANELK